MEQNPSAAFMRDVSIPEEFPEVLKGFSREVLRTQPENINEFAAKYFQRKLEELDAEAANKRGDDEDEVDVDSIEQIIQDLFTTYDDDQSGYLDRQEFANLLADMRSRLPFITQDDLLFFQAEADLNGDGCIEYAEFIPIALQIVQTMYAKKRMEKKENAVQEAVENALVHGMNRDELMACLEGIFHEVDTDGSGTLSREEFTNALSGMELGLTRREINSLLFQIDANEDGCISYSEFMPLAFDLLRKLTEMRIFETQYQDDDMVSFLGDLFKTKDEELERAGVDRAAGTISSDDVKQLLHEAQLGLTRLQIYSVLSVAEENEQGYIAWQPFIPKAVEVIRSMLSFANEVTDQVAQKEESAAVCEAIAAGLGDCAVCTVGQLQGAVQGIEGLDEQMISGLLALGRGLQKGGEIDVQKFFADVPGLLKNQRKYSEDVSPRHG